MVWCLTCGMASKMVKFCDEDSLDNLTSEVSTYSQNLLILGCSQRKRSDSGLLRAIARYDGPTFQVLRRFLKQQPQVSNNISTYILSAEFGLIPQDFLIPYYDRRMTASRAIELRSTTVAKLSDIVNSRPYEEVFLCMGQIYFQAIQGYEAILPNNLNMQVASGSLGRKLGELHDWLHGKPPEIPQSKHKNINLSKNPIIKGVEVLLTTQEVLNIAHQSLEKSESARKEGFSHAGSDVRSSLVQCPVGAACPEGLGKEKPRRGYREFANFQSWYVVVGNERVAPKWLVSQITGLPVSNFSTKEALRLLVQLGIEVNRV
jgi:hypothetical protein